MKTNFIRKPEASELIPQDEFVIEKVIKLSNNEFTSFIHNPLLDYDFIKENKELMRIDNNEIYHCILVTGVGYDFGILVNSEGSSYARYASFIPLLILKEMQDGNKN